MKALLAAGGLEVSSSGLTQQRLLPQSSNTWRWTIWPPQPGIYHPVIDLTVRWAPKPGSDSPGPVEEAMWSRALTIEARTLLGLSGSQIDWLGLGGSVMGAVAGFPFAQKALMALWGRLRGQNNKEVADY